MCADCSLQFLLTNLANHEDYDDEDHDAVHACVAVFALVKGLDFLARADITERSLVAFSTLDGVSWRPLRRNTATHGALVKDGVRRYRAFVHIVPEQDLGAGAPLIVRVFL